MLVEWKSGSLVRMWENLRVAYQAVLSNGYRSLLTILMMAVGIAALVGMLAASDALRASVQQQYAHLGARSFHLAPKPEGTPLREMELLWLQQTLAFPGTASLYAVRAGCVVQSVFAETPPNVGVVGTDEGFASLQGLSVAHGRFLRSEEVAGRTACLVLGAALAEALFAAEDPLGQWVRVMGKRFRVIGVLAPCNDRPGLDCNRMACVPRGSLPLVGESSWEMGFRPGAALSQGQVDSLVQQVRVQFRSIRGVRPEVADDFDLHRSEALLGELEESLNLIAKVSLVIAILALFGAGVGLMNTLLISLRERTREVGVCMALGATSGQVQTQFLCEAGMMGFLGAGLGIALGLLLGWGCAQWFGGVFVFPWGWVLWALMLSWGIALLAGSLPARRAAQLVPMEALREL